MKINPRNRLIGTDDVYANNTYYNARAYRFAYSLPNAVLNHCAACVSKLRPEEFSRMPLALIDLR